MNAEERGLGAAKGCLVALALTGLVTLVFGIPAIVYFLRHR